MSSLIQDLRFALRTLRRRPGFTAVAVLTLALGIGANAAIFSVVDGVLLRPLPYPEPDRLERLFIETIEARFAFSVADFQFLGESQKSFERLATFRARRVTLSGTDRPRRIAVTWVSAGYFDTLGVEPVLGRGFEPGDDRTGAERRVVISHRFWQHHFDADGDVLDRFVVLDGLGYRIIGVLAQDFRAPGQRADLWAVEQLESATRRGPFFHDVVARRRAGTTPAQAENELADLSRLVGARWPGSLADGRVRYVRVPLRRELVGDVGKTLFVLLGAVAFVLLMATANVAHLLLAKASARRREMALRATLGASHGRLVRQLATESALLAALGGVAGLLLAAWGLDLLLAWSPEDLPRRDEVRLDHRVLGFTAVVTAVSGLLCGLAPLKSSLSFRLADRLRGEGASSPPSDRRLRGLFVAAELALALPLLVAAGLMVRSFLELRQVDPGFDPRSTLTVELSLPETRYGEDGEVRVFYDELLRRVETIPGVAAAGLGSSLPPNDLWRRHALTLEGLAPAADATQPVSGWITVGPGYFPALRIPLRRGRAFTEGDRDGALPVAIVDETLARRYFPGESPIGRRIRVADCVECPWRTVVGVVGRVKYNGLGAPDEPAVYVPRAQETRRAMYLAIRTGGDPRGLAPRLREILETLDPGLALAEVATLDSLLVESTAESRYRMSLLGTFAGVALALAALGIYGVLSFFVRQSSREIGIRMALGAPADSVRKLVLGQGLGHVAFGVGAGFAATLALTRFLASLLYGVSATDPAIFTGVTMGLVAVAFAACFLPAHRATRIDPIVVLRHE